MTTISGHRSNWTTQVGCMIVELLFPLNFVLSSFSQELWLTGGIGMFLGTFASFSGRSDMGEF